MSAVRARARTVPAPLWLAVIVLVSVAARVALDRRIVAPWIMVDEIVYSELAKSLATHGAFLIRGTPAGGGYGVVYPLLIAPAWRLFGPMPAVYSAAKAINCVVMSLAAIPAYLLARRLLPAGLSLAVAVLSVLVPEMLYTGMIMTENVFYPVFLTAALMFVLTLERPTWRRQVVLLALFVLAYETRAQAVALLAAIATAPLLLAFVRGRGLGTGLRPFAPLYGLLALGAVGAVGETVARGRSPLTLLGAYDAATSSAYTVSGVAHYFLYHLAWLDLYLGVIPFAALAAMWFAPRGSSPAREAFVVASFTLTLWLLAEVAAFASQPSVQRIEERNMFYVAPFAFVALLGLGRDGLVPRRGRALLLAAAGSAVLPLAVPFTRFLTTSAVSDTFAMLPWWWVQDHLVTLQQVRWAALGSAVAASVLFVLLPRRFALVEAALVALYLVVTTAVVDNGRHGIHLTSVGSLYAGTHLAHPDWIDRTVGRGGSVIVLWTAHTTAYPVWEDEFFNRSLGAVYDYDGAPVPDPLPERPAERASSGVLLSDGKPIEARYVLTDGSAGIGGTLVRSDPIGFGLYRVDGPVMILTTVHGVYADTWSGRSVRYERVDCGGGRLSVLLESDATLFHRVQTVTAREQGRVVGRARITPTGESTLTVPLQPGPGRRCQVAFTVAHTAVPARIEPGNADTRVLGAHFLSFGYHP